MVPEGTTFKLQGGQSITRPVVLETNAVLDNAGHIAVSTGTAVEAKNSSTGGSAVLNHDGGSIQGADRGLLFHAPGVVKNSSGGVITGGSVGIEMADGGLISNSGAGSAIRSSGIAIRITGAKGTIGNADGATISGGRTAIYLEHGGSVVNGAGSIIQATGSAGSDCGQGSGCGIFVASNSTDPNGAEALELTNEGTIIGSVLLNLPAYNQVNLLAGSSIHGDLGIGNGTLTLGGGDGTSQLYSQAVTGTTEFTGLFSKIGGGTWVIDNDDIDAGYIVVDGGTLKLGTGGTVGSVGQGDVDIRHGELVFDRSDDVVLDANIRGGESDANDGTLVQAGTGTLTVLMANEINPSNIAIRSGTLQIDNTGDMPIDEVANIYFSPNIADDGLLAFNSNLKIRYGGTISGSGGLLVDGSGELTLQGSNSYTGGTTINRGVLRVGTGGTTGSIIGDVSDNAALAFNRSDEVIFSGLISGSGSLEQRGAGTLILTGRKYLPGRYDNR